MLLELLYQPQFLSDRILKMQYLQFFLSRYQYVLNMADALYYILKIVWD